MDIALRNLHDMRVACTHAHAHARVCVGPSICISMYVVIPECYQEDDSCDEANERDGASNV